MKITKRSKSLTVKAARFPRAPGVYLFKDAGGKVLYVGKAKNIRNRVRSYFLDKDTRPQVEFLVRRAADIEFIVTSTEKEALLFENTLIKEHRPRYNIHLKDDRSYISIRLGMGHEFPGIAATRKIRKDGAEYFGPYDSGLAARETLNQVIRHFRLRTCSDREFLNRMRPCLKFDIGRCTGPCSGKVTASEYARQVEEAKLFLNGRKRELLRGLEKRMREASTGLMYEDAARFRDTIAMLKDAIEEQIVVKHGRGDSDVVGMKMEGPHAAICVLNVRGGALTGRRMFHLDNVIADGPSVIEEFLVGFYKEPAGIPTQIAVSIRPAAPKAVAGILTERKGQRVEVLLPRRGVMARLVSLALSNVVEALEVKARLKGAAQVLDVLGRKLQLGSAPDVIECVDISNLQGREAVGSLVCFAGGVPEKTCYRIYNIRMLNTPDDYGMMREVLSRRFDGGLPLPDLLLLDGGKGQLAQAVAVLKEFGISLPLAAIAKAREKGEADKIFIPNRKNPLKFKKGSRELLFLMCVRDEAHRFAVNAHRKRRTKKLSE